MNLVPQTDTKYVLLRTFRGRVHIITYTRYADDSGMIQHGQSLHGWEFDPTLWSEAWSRLRSAGWQLLEDAVTTGLAQPNALPDCTNCDCQIPDNTEFLDERNKRGLPLRQINREWREYAKTFHHAEQELLGESG
jgi:hypothetical protein